MAAFWAELISNLLPTVLTVVTALFGWLGTKIAGAVTSKNKAEAAAAKIGQVALAIAGSIWTSLSEEIKIRLADGDLSKEDREALAGIVMLEIKKLDIGDTVEEIAKALGLPLTSVIGTIVEWLVNRFTSAHDASITTVSAKAYPVGPGGLVKAPSQAINPANLGMGG